MLFSNTYLWQVADVLRHESGLAWVNHSFKTTDFLPENIKKNVIGEVLEKEPYHEPLPAGPMKIKTPREYHAVTRALVLNEIVRRVDPRQRTIGEILLEVRTDNSSQSSHSTAQLTQCCRLFAKTWYSHSI